jgi:plasmid stabilization system protein ParE
VRRVKLPRLAREDLRDSYLWYETQRKGLGAEFLSEVLATLRRAAGQFALFPVVDHEYHVRRALLKRFPYKVFFTVEPDRIVVHAIINASRSEGVWKSRIR